MMAKYVYAVTPDVMRLSRLMVNKGLKPGTTDADRQDLYAAYEELRDRIKKDIRDRKKAQFPMGVLVNFYITTRPPRGGDPDGYEKYIIDAMCDGLGIDDRNILFRGVTQDIEDGEEYALCTVETVNPDLEWPDDELDGEGWELRPGQIASAARIRDPVSLEKRRIESW